MGRAAPAAISPVPAISSRRLESSFPPVQRVEGKHPSYPHSFSASLMTTVSYSRLCSLGARQRCGHPGQQHGRRMPPSILSMPTAMRRCRVASCLGEVTQQIHSLRASGVSSGQSFRTVACAPMALRRSAGNSCTVPPASLGVVMLYMFVLLARSARRRRLDAGPLEGIRPFPKGEILGDLSVAEHEAIGETSAAPRG